MDRDQRDNFRHAVAEACEASGGLLRHDGQIVFDQRVLRRVFDAIIAELVGELSASLESLIDDDEIRQRLADELSAMQARLDRGVDLILARNVN